MSLLLRLLLVNMELILGRCGPLRIWLGLELNWYRPRGR